MFVDIRFSVYCLEKCRRSPSDDAFETSYPRLRLFICTCSVKRLARNVISKLLASLLSRSFAKFRSDGSKGGRGEWLEEERRRRGEGKLRRPFRFALLLVFFNASRLCCEHSRIKRETESRFNAINRRVQTTKICDSIRYHFQSTHSESWKL